MTFLPSHNANDRPDLPRYELAPYCAVPGCTNFREEGGGHHVWRRSNRTHSFWVELSDGTLVPNRVGLCFRHHRDVTGQVGGHRARITIRDGFNLTWETKEADEYWLLHGRLVWAINPYDVLTEGEDFSGPLGFHAATPSSIRKEDGPSPSVSTPGTKCPECQRRIPHPKKPTSPASKVSSYRVPLDDADVHNETLETWAAHWGLIEKPHWKFWLLNFAAADALAGPKKELG